MAPDRLMDRLSTEAPSSAAMVISASASRVEFPETEAETVLLMVLEAMDALAATPAAAPTPRVRAAIFASEPERTSISPSRDVTAASTTLAATVLSMSLSEAAALPAPASPIPMLPARERMLAVNPDELPDSAARRLSSTMSGRKPPDRKSPREGATSDADTRTWPKALTVESVIVAVVRFCRSLRVTEACPANPPAPDRPAARVRMAEPDRDLSLTAPARESTVEPLMAVPVRLTMTFLEIAAPAPMAPPPDRPMAMESVVEESVAESRTSPVELMSEAMPSSLPTMEASTVLPMELTLRDSWAEAMPEADTPPTKLRMSASDRASRLTLPAPTSEPEIRARMVLSISL
ncbi:hypothetical protein DSECCO2_657430 [anaerobic digester metagenome]